MLIALFILNGLLALAFLGAGGSKLARPRTALAASGMGWVDDASDGQVKLVGALEVLGAIGLILPIATGIAPVLSPIAALGLLVVMIGAVSVHRRRHENPTGPLVLGVLTAASAVLGFLTV